MQLRKTITPIFLIVGLFFLMTSPTMATMAVEKQRELFSEAQNALKKGQIRKFSRISKQLTDYPLYGYLQFDYLSRRLSHVDDARIKDFMSVYDDSPISERMRFRWLRILERRGKWQTYIEAYQPGGGIQFACAYARALYKTNQIEKANKEAEKLWLVGKSQPQKCDVVFESWKKNGGMTEEHLWGRIELAMEKGRSSLANFVAKSLNTEGQEWVSRWREMHKRPAENLHRKYYQVDATIPNKIVRHGVKRLARRDAGAAADFWEKVRDKHLRTAPKDVHEIDRIIAMQAGLQKHPRALEWLGKLQNPDESTQLWRIRAALSQQDWWSALSWIDSLPSEERNSDQWRYWRGRILEIQSETLPALKTASERIYSTLSENRSYHGFLAADRLGAKYKFQSNPLNYNAEELGAIEKVPGVMRSRELLQLGLKVDARREWNYVIDKFNEEELKKASVLANQWGWHDRAISTIAKAEHFDDLDLRFPTAYKDIITEQAQDQGIEAAWIYGILRQESIFMADARSNAGALGLMQLMPSTGRLTARELKFRIRSNKDLLNIEQNIRLGSAYLRRMLDENNGNGALATASYNAGPYRVKKWLPEEDMPSDIWVETIPYNETRNYVRRVMSYTVIYDEILGGQRGLISSRMPIIKARSREDS